MKKVYKAYAGAVTLEEIWKLIQDGGRRTCACAYLTPIPGPLVK